MRATAGRDPACPLSLYLDHHSSAILSWLIAFNVVNIRNDVVRTILNCLYQLTEPVLAPIRRRLPDLGGIDISPIVLHPRRHS